MLCFPDLPPGTDAGPHQAEPHTEGRSAVDPQIAQTFSHSETAFDASDPADSQQGQALPTLAGSVSEHEAEIDHILISEQEIKDAVRRLGEEITADYAGKELILVGVLKGAFMLMADLARHIHLPLEFDFMAVSSYGAATKSSGVVRILKDLEREIQGRDVLLVEDIVDSGLTLNYLLKNLRTRRPASVEVCALLHKTETQRAPVSLKYRGFEIPSEFVVGYGLDFDERYRNLPYIGTLKRESYRSA